MASHLSRILSIPNPELQIREIPDPEKPIGDPTIPGSRVDTPLFGLNGYVPLKRVCFLVSSLKEFISFHAVSRLQQDVKSVKVGDERSTFEVPTVFFPENAIHKISLTLYSK